MSRPHPVHRCTNCDATVLRWVGRCPACGEWNTLVVDTAAGSPGLARAAPPLHQPVPIGQVPATECRPVPTGLTEVDRVLGGGLVPGSVTLLGGEPGVGKSTLLLQIMGHLGQRCLLIAAEESPQQVRLRAERLETVAPDTWIVAAAEVTEIAAHVEELEPAVLVVDSIQAIADPSSSAAPGSVAQVRACAHHLVRMAKERMMTTVLVGHVTKDGSLAGPRVLEHLVDTVLSFVGDRHHALRLLRAVKHRFGPTTELGLFEMGEGGLDAVHDAGHLFLSDRRLGGAGSVVAPVLDGRRPLVVELQALVAPAPPGFPPRRSAQGLDGGRLAQLLAVLERRAGVRTSTTDVYALAVGGARVNDPGADLPMALAVASSGASQAVPADMVACAEVGLGGELRQVREMGRRLAEAQRLGFRRAIVPVSAPLVPEGMKALPAATLVDAVRIALVDERLSRVK
jgi:DNA repair protein RadA/Sms